MIKYSSKLQNEGQGEKAVLMQNDSDFKNNIKQYCYFFSFIKLLLQIDKVFSCVFYIHRWLKHLAFSIKLFGVRVMQIDHDGSVIYKKSIF